jgi:signal transduction histidine kinase
MIWPLIPLALGEATRSRRQLIALAEVEHERAAQDRVDEERARMARELHDVLAHTMAAVNVQMAAAIAAFDVDPEKARTALQQARASTRAALRELQATVSVQQSRDTAPPPRLDQLDQLVTTVEAAGIDVTVVDERNGAELSEALELTAYRIVQEALTTVLRHSGAALVAVSLRTSADGLVVVVTDDGVGGTDTRPESNGGAGLIGMTERARSVGGRAEHGPLPLGGHRVWAVLPLESDAP